MKTIPIVLALFLLQVPQASIKGRVVRLGTDSPVARARLALTRIQGQLTDIRTVTAGENGEFSIPNLARGQYRLFAEREGYVRTEYGQRGASRTGTVITVADPQEIRYLVVSMIPTGVIAGRVRDANGHPIRNVVVRALKAVYREGQRSLNSQQMAETNDLGEYRIFGLPPGLYFVSALPRPGPRLEGDVYVVPTIPTRANGNRRETRTPGTDAVAAGIVDPGVFDRETFLTVYYPGTTDITTAVPMNLQPGATVSGIDLGIARSSTVNIRGRVINGVTGQPAENVVVSVIQQGEGRNGRSGQAALGWFDIPGVTAGPYEVTAQTISATERLFARMPIEVSDRDIENLSLILQPGFTLTGRFTVEGLSAGNNNFKIGRPFVQLEPGTAFGGGYSVRVGSDGAFTVSNLNPGDYRLRIVAMPQTWYIKSAVFGTTNVLETRLHVEAEPRTSFNIVVSANGGVLDALVLDAERQPAQGVTVALVPGLPRRDRYDLYKTSATDASGRVRLQGIAPGEYKAFAWVDIDADSWQDSSIIRLYEHRGEPVQFDEGERRSITLNVIGRSQ